jgi:rhodanese-related sulfurtransferase
LDILPIDVRPYSAFVLSHITGAVNVKLSGLLVRRLAAGKISVEDLLQEQEKEVFQSRVEHSLLVVYDEKATLGGDQDPKMIVINALRKAGFRTAFLSGE